MDRYGINDCFYNYSTVPLYLSSNLLSLTFDNDQSFFKLLYAFLKLLWQMQKKKGIAYR